MSRYLLIFFLIILISRSALGQFTYRLDQSIPVTVDNKLLQLPWVGGFNAAQINKMDLDHDGDEDLVIFDRTSNKVLTFVDNNKTWVYAPFFESMFPIEIDQWLILRDFNCDGKKDIFTHNPFGIVAYVNTTVGSGQLTWRQFNVSIPYLQTGGTSQPINIQVNSVDIPGISDVDSDGDLDILDARFSGVGTLEWQKNMSMEKTGSCDSMQFVRVTSKWGNFEECNCGEYKYTVDSTCSGFVGGRTDGTKHAAGKSILTIDVDNDGDKDLLFSEETCEDIYFLRNMGTKDSAVMTGFTTYPESNPIVGLSIYPATYYEDVDFDGVPDLMATSNSYARLTFDNDFQHSAWYYKNTGTETLPEFTFVQKNFLQDQMIEVGDNAVPAFFDADGDGDLDMFIGSYTSENIVSYLYYYENTGTVTTPAFKFITKDYASISSLGYYNLKPQFADMNSDGTQDLVFTATTVQASVTSLYYIPNKSKTQLNITPSDVVTSTFNLDQDENMSVVDVNQDGLNDVLQGASTGALIYWKNTGPAGALNYVVQNDSLLGIRTSTARQNPVAAVGDLNADGKTDLILSDQSGTLTIYDNFRSHQISATGMTNVLWDSLTQTYTGPNFGGRQWPVVANLFGTDKPGIVIGSLLGGVQYLKNDSGSELPTDALINLYPNPVLPDKILKIFTDRIISGQFFTILGQRIFKEFTVPANELFSLDVSSITSGVYILQLTSNQKTYIRRVIIP